MQHQRALSNLTTSVRDHLSERIGDDIIHALLGAALYREENDNALARGRTAGPEGEVYSCGFAFIN